MEELALSLFPYPHVFRGERRAGTLIDWPAICARCDRQCELPTSSGELKLCSYGLNFLRVDDDLLIAGVAVSDYPQTTEARRKRLREVGRDAITTAALHRVIERCSASTEAQAAELAERLEAVVQEYRESQGYQREIVDLLRPEFERTLGQVHDYKLFVQQIIQNMNVIFENRFPGLDLDDKLEKATHEETAIYWAATLMDERLDAALFLEQPERIHEEREQGSFRLHGLVLKYVRIYKSRAERQRVGVSVSGASWADIGGNARALAIIPHTLIDNALKYAPPDTYVTVKFIETDTTVTLEIESFGPEITPEEAPRIFDLFYRAKAARRASSEGTGFGLASAQNVAKAHDTQIVVKQTDRRGPADTYLTSFSVTFPRAGKQSSGVSAR